MRRLLLCSVTGLLALASQPTLAQQTPPTTPAAVNVTPPAPTACTGTPDPYANFACLDPYLGDNVFGRLFNYYKLEWGQAVPPTDPNALSSRREGWPDAPMTTPPMPFTEWPYGGTTSIGVTRPNSVDSPLMNAISNTSFGQWLNDAHIQIYGWINAGGNLSTNTTRPGGNAPVAYAYTPNTVQFDQGVIYIDRTPDTVQNDHFDWGFRISGIYGENYRYTTSYGIASYQLLNQNRTTGYDFPMVYGELYFPFVQGLLIRIGRYISLPDIEAQLAPNNYMYTHSLTYAYDNYTNEGVQASLQLTENVLVQLGVSMGSDTAVWHYNEKVNNPYPNPLYPGSTFLKDPGAKPSFTGCIRIDWNNGNDNLYPCMDAINNGVWGYNNLQWYGFTYYHKFDDHWHISFEFYDLHQNGVANLNNPAVSTIIANGGTPFSPQYLPYNAPNGAHCASTTVYRCTAYAIGQVAYLNYSPDPMNNFSFRPEAYLDPQGQRTGTPATYLAMSLGWQHWFSPQLEVRPEIGYYHSFGGYAFNGDANKGVSSNKNNMGLLAGDFILHF